MRQFVVLFAMLLFTQKSYSANLKYDQILILAGDKHKLSAFMPHLNDHLSEQAKIAFYGMNVNPNKGNHLKDLKKVDGLIRKDFTTDKKILVLAWSISSKLLVDLIQANLSINKIIMFDPMDGSPPLSRESKNRPHTTSRKLSRTDLNVLIIKAQLRHRSHVFFKPICDKPSAEFRKFVKQYENTKLQTRIISSAGHLDLIYDPFGFRLVACKSGTKKRP